MLLYLDIDGVMVPAKSWKRPEIMNDGFPEFSLKAIESLNKIISYSCADIVLTTSHKSIYSLNEWKNIFERRNIKANKIGRLPKNVNHLNRKDELLNWFNAGHLDDDFIIVDDDKSLNGLPEFIKNKLIQTSASIGLTENLTNQALDLIEKSKYEIA